MIHTEDKYCTGCGKEGEEIKKGMKFVIGSVKMEDDKGHTLYRRSPAINFHVKKYEDIY